MSLYLPASSGKRKEAWVRLADLTAHNSELRERFSGTNLFHKYNIFFCSQNTHKHIAVSLHIFLWIFLAHFHELFASSLFAVFNAWNPSGWLVAVGHVHHMLLFLLVPGRDCPSSGPIQCPLMSMRVSLFDFSALGSSPLLGKELEEDTGLWVSQAGLIYLGTQQTFIFPIQAFLSSAPKKNWSFQTSAGSNILFPYNLCSYSDQWKMGIKWCPA